MVGNMALATLAGGPFGGWYYFGPSDAYNNGMVSVNHVFLSYPLPRRSCQDHLMQPRNPTLHSLGHAFKSMGSIAFGSLIVTLLEMIRLVVDALRSSAAADGDSMLFNSHDVLQI